MDILFLGCARVAYLQSCHAVLGMPLSIQGFFRCLYLSLRTKFFGPTDSCEERPERGVEVQLQRAGVVVPGATVHCVPASVIRVVPAPDEQGTTTSRDGCAQSVGQEVRKGFLNRKGSGNPSIVLPEMTNVSL